MTYIKWRRNRPFVYKSERVTETEITTDANGRISVADGKEKIASRYMGSYQKYRDNKPCGDYTALVPSETVLKWLSKYPERLAILSSIDAAAHLQFAREQSA